MVTQGGPIRHAEQPDQNRTEVPAPEGPSQLMRTETVSWQSKSEGAMAEGTVQNVTQQAGTVARAVGDAVGKRVEEVADRSRKAGAEAVSETMWSIAMANSLMPSGFGPSDPFHTLHSEMNRLFDDVFRGSPGRTLQDRSTQPGGAVTTSMDLSAGGSAARAEAGGGGDSSAGKSADKATTQSPKQ